MSGKANNALIGGFVLGAILLFIVAIVLFGAGNFFAKKRKHVLFFDGSIKGLDIGAPVMFSGVKIGSVTDIKVKMSSADESFEYWIPVFIETEPRSFTEADIGLGLGEKGAGSTPPMETLIKKGLRAQLQIQSILTGKLFVAVDFFPDKPAILLGHEKGISEIPTIPTSFQEVADTATKIIHEIQKLPVHDLLNNATELLKSLKNLVNSPDTADIMPNLNSAIKNVQNLVQDIDNQITPGLGDTIDNMNATVLGLRKVLQNIDSQVTPLISNIDEAVQVGRDAFSQTEQTLQAAQIAIFENSPLREELMETLESLSATARSLKVLADYLGRHPEALLKGKD
ncbi:MAG: MlaD family protein [Thermodesulfobacteriota bacterium]|nr:MlaD family protein [Thermodesulfobacteriota bacterium]